MTSVVTPDTHDKIKELIASMTDPQDALKIMALLVVLWSRALDYQKAQLHGTPMDILRTQLEFYAILGELGL